jgi:dihydrofolate synthase / folylpolyglutamate synthase
MNYAETLEFLFNQLPAYHRIGKAAYKNSLDNTLRLDEHFGRPHTRFRSVHVTGTNGKGSVSHMTASVLQEAGHKTGLYTSPHLTDFRERIRINGEMIPESEVTGFVERNIEIIRSISPSFFEMTVAMAFDYFAREEVEVAVVEVGLGGRLDSTNIITPVLPVITNIGHDHMDLLGDTLEKVAFEKAGIIKSGIPVLIGETQDEVKHVFVSYAGKAGAEIHFADQTFRCVPGKYDPVPGTRDFTIHRNDSDHIVKGTTPLGGDYQARNITTVFAIIDLIGENFGISEKNLVDGIRKVVENTGLAGRWQIVGLHPLIICDTGHNREGIAYIAGQLAMLPKRKLHMVIGFVSDKDLSQVLPLLPVDAMYYFTRASVLRAMDEKSLMREAGKYFLTGESYPDVKSALASAVRNAQKDDVIFVGGSTFVVGDM